MRLALAVGLLVLSAAPAAGSGRVEKLLHEGKLAEGEKTLAALLQDKPDDEAARFALGIVRFLRSFEKLSASLYEHSARPPLFAFLTDGKLDEWAKPHPRPKTLTHAKLYRFIQAWIDDLRQASVELDKVRGKACKLVLRPGRIPVDLSGRGKPASALEVLRNLNGRDHETTKRARTLEFAFDRADAAWLCGYCHFLMALGEAVQSLDGKEVVQTHAHLLFSKVDTPYTFLTEEPTPVEMLNRGNGDYRPYIDLCTLSLSLLRLPVKEPARLKKALAHLETMVARSRQMWKWVLEETDDDREWIRGPKQTGALGVKVTQEMVDNWLLVLDEAGALLKGAKLLPFWRGSRKGVGVNLRKTFTHPAKDFNVPGWVQGPAALPYLEKGPVTRLADPAVLRKLDRAFGGLGFFGYAFWFN
jgi:hypothetical protein